MAIQRKYPTRKKQNSALTVTQAQDPTVELGTLFGSLSQRCYATVPQPSTSNPNKIISRFPSSSLQRNMNGFKKGFQPGIKSSRQFSTSTVQALF